MRRPETPPNWMRPFLQPENPTDIPSARSVQPSVLAHSPFGFLDRKSTRLNSSHSQISYAVFCLKKKKLLFDRVRRLLRSPRVLIASWETTSCNSPPDCNPSRTTAGSSTCEPTVQ